MLILPILKKVLFKKINNTSFLSSIVYSLIIVHKIKYMITNSVYTHTHTHTHPYMEKVQVNGYIYLFKKLKYIIWITFF